ncbi:MAG: DUF2933 domain-containing protein [Candidatus Rokubacteria bacterium]|nr:DUF2933 domain-containing protein [Candidatus Rokubacteria bacterium]
MAKPTETRYCPVCGEDAAVHGLLVERFGEAFCSERHAEEFAREVRQRRVAAAVTAEAAANPGQPAEASREPAWSPKRLMKWGACLAAPLVLVVLLLGGGSALGAAGSSLLYLAALAACPAAMYLMMRGMQHHGKTPQASESEGDKRPEPSSAGDPGMKRPSRSGNEGF